MHGQQDIKKKKVNSAYANNRTPIIRYPASCIEFLTTKTSLLLPSITCFLQHHVNAIHVFHQNTNESLAV